jgi:glyoxylase-like metal-dependent hydrolase (beta-lactamase superfamily II)
VSGASTDAARTPRIEVGGWTIHALDDGRLRLDGGAMWGVVPKNLWATLTPPAPDNTIALALRPYLCVKGDRVLLIEAGVGARWESKWRGIYHLDGGRLEASLRATGYRPEDVTDAVASHAHWDHVGGWLVERAGRIEPLLPRARHWLAAVEVERCLHHDHVRRGSYRPEDLAPLVEAGRVATFESVGEILPEVEVRPVGGHSDGVSVVIVGPRGGERAIFWADVVPTTHHVQPPYIMAYDIDVVTSFAARKALLAEAARERWVGLFYHDTDVPFARVVADGKRYAVEPIAAR